MDTAETYRLNEAKQQERLGEFHRSGNLMNLTSEVALCKVLLESATNQNNICMARDLLLASAALQKAARAARERDGETIDKTAIHHLASEVVTIIIDEFGDVENFNDRIDRVTERMASAITQTKNESDK